MTTTQITDSPPRPAADASAEGCPRCGGDLFVSRHDGTRMCRDCGDEVRAAGSAAAMLSFNRPPRPSPFVPCLPVGAIAEPAEVRAAAGGGYEVVGIATVSGPPDRKDADARQLAVRIALRPLTYLPMLTGLRVAGVVDVRASFGGRPAAPGTPSALPRRIVERREEMARNLPLLDRTAAAAGRHLRPQDRDEMRQDMAFGLARAIDRYDPAAGVPFGRYAARYMRRAAVDGLRARTGRTASRRAVLRPASLDVPVGDDGEGPARSALLADARSVDPGEAVAAREGFERLVRPILDPQMAAVVRLRFFSGLDLADVARRVGLGRSRVTQLTRQALDIMRRHAEADGLAA